MSSPYLAPIERPKGLVMKLIYFFMRRQFGKAAARTFMVFPPRMPFAFTRFYMKSYALDKKLTLSRELQALIREQVASTNGCLFCMDAGRYYALKSQVTDAARFDALPEYRSSALFMRHRLAGGQRAPVQHDQHRSQCRIRWSVRTPAAGPGSREGHRLMLIDGAAGEMAQHGGDGEVP